MWGLVIIVLMSGQFETKVFGYNDETTCNISKAKVLGALATEVPNAKVSLTCVKLNKFGGIS